MFPGFLFLYTTSKGMQSSLRLILDQAWGENIGLEVLWYYYSCKCDAQLAQASEVI